MSVAQRKEDDRNPYEVVLVAKDGREFKVNRQVLSEACPYFEKLFSSNMKECNEGVIQLAILTNSQMTDILKFIYTGKVQIPSEEHAEAMIVAADYLFLSNLKQRLRNFWRKICLPQTVYAFTL